MSKIEKAFIFNDVDEDLLVSNHDLGQGWTLRKATSEELQNHQFRFDSKSWAKRRGWTHGYPPQLQVWKEIKGKDYPQVYNRPPKSEEELLEIARVMVLEASNTVGINEFSLKNALAICDAEFRLGISFYKGGRISNGSLSFPYFQLQNRLYTGFNNYKRPSLVNIQDIKDTVALFSKGIPENINHSIFLFRLLDDIPDYAPIKILGYFTVIESILTERRSTDSISHQLKDNLEFVDERLAFCGRSLGFEDLAKKNPKTIIRDLYDYRSAIAHGRSSEKSIKKIINARTENTSIIDDQLWIHDWLRKMTRRILFEAVNEPERLSEFVKNTTPNNVYSSLLNWLRQRKILTFNKNQN